MTAKEYLGQIRLAEIRIRQMEEQLDGCHRQNDGVIVQHSQSNATEDRLISRIDREREILAAIEEQTQLRLRITMEIHKLNNATYIQLLYARYVRLQKFEQIALDMGYEYSWVRHLHKDALDAFAELYGLEREAAEN